jgi:hypothetical protein
MPTATATMVTVVTATASHSHQGSLGQGRDLMAATSAGVSRRGRPIS